MDEDSHPSSPPARLESEAAQGRLRSLLAANHSVVEDLDLDQVLRHIAEAAVALVDAQYGALGVIDADGRLEQFVHVGMPADAADRIGHLPEGHGILGAVVDSDAPIRRAGRGRRRARRRPPPGGPGILGAVVDSDAPIRLEDLGADPRSIGFPPHHPPMASFLGVPIRIRDDTYGNLYLTNPASGVFTAEDEELVTALAATAAVAIDNARLYAESQRAGGLSIALSEVTVALLAPDAGEVFGVVAESIASLVHADLVTIMVPAGAATEHRVETARGIGADAIEGTVVSGAGSVVSSALASGRVESSGAGGDAPWLGHDLTGGSTLASPLVVSGTPVGVLCVTRGPSGVTFSRADLATVSEFATRAGVAIALARARADRQRLDMIDDRARIARDLHDHVIQRLFGAGLGLQALASVAPEHAAVIDTHVTEIGAAMADIRTAIFALQTSSSESARHRLMDVVSDLTRSLAAAPRISFVGPVDLLVNGGLADDVVAVVRESLTNVARHAQADTAAVEVTVTHSDVTVVVDDDGIGPPALPSRASGTANLAVRARAHGGVFTLEPRTSGGTRARWWVPLTPPSEV